MNIIVEQGRSGQWYASAEDLAAVGRTEAEAIEGLRNALLCDLTKREADEAIEGYLRCQTLKRGQTPFRQDGPPDAA